MHSGNPYTTISSAPPMANWRRQTPMTATNLALNRSLQSISRLAITSLFECESHRCSLGCSYWPRWSISCSSGCLSNATPIIHSHNGDLYRHDTCRCFALLSPNPARIHGPAHTYHVLALGHRPLAMATGNSHGKIALMRTALRGLICANVCYLGIRYDWRSCSAYRLY
jgi:hypothetical protein